MMIAANREGESVTAINKEGKESREETILRIRRGIRSAQLRVALDEVRGRETPEAVVRLAQLTPPKLPSPFVTLRTPDGTLRRDPEARRALALHIRRNILAAQLRVALDEQRGRPTPDAVKRLAKRELPPLG
jgi:hypothetical protein